MQRTTAFWQRRQADATYRRQRDAARIELVAQAGRVEQAEDTWRMADPGTHAEAAAWSWRQRQREILWQMVADARAAGVEVPPLVAETLTFARRLQLRVRRRLTWGSFWRSRAGEGLLIGLAAAAAIAAWVAVYVAATGGWGR